MSEQAVIVGSDLHVKTVEEWKHGQEAKEAALHSSRDQAEVDEESKGE